MSWQTINKVLGLAMIDKQFAENLLQDPYEALSSYGIQLSPNELRVFCACQGQTLEDLSRQLMKELGPESSK